MYSMVVSWLYIFMYIYKHAEKINYLVEWSSQLPTCEVRHEGSPLHQQVRRFVADSSEIKNTMTQMVKARISSCWLRQ